MLHVAPDQPPEQEQTLLATHTPLPQPEGQDGPAGVLQVLPVQPLLQEQTLLATHTPLPQPEGQDGGGE
jgi:hypothetical protein